MQSEPFQIFVNYISNKVVKIPLTSTILRCVEDLYEEDKNAIKIFINSKSTPVISISFDLWTEKSQLKRNFLNVQLQFSCDFKVYNLNLATCSFPLKKTGENLANKIKDLLKDFNIDNKFVVFITDKGANVLQAVKILLSEKDIKGITLECLNHGLNNLINEDMFKGNHDFIRSVSKVLEKLRNIRKSLTYRLKEIKP